MKIKSIKYKNYRCFMDMTIDFSIAPSKSIFMVLAPNGGGKTEMLFSFQWVLYDFDFKQLKGKEDTPYALNSTLYQSLCFSNPGDSKTCSVELEFEAAGRTYIMIRNEKFTKKYKNNELSSEQSVSLSYTNANGVRQNPETDLEAVTAQLSKIIPKSILQGIIFDGERMKQLSNVDNESKKAVEGVIRQITNEELFERCKVEFEQLLKVNSSAYKRLSKVLGADDFAELENTLQNAINEVRKKEEQVDLERSEMRMVKARLDDIHRELANSRETKNLEDKRTEYKEQFNQTIKEVEELYLRLQDDLDDGYLLICDPVLADVKKLLDEYDIPAGLTVTAVQNILSRNHCICGKEFTPDARKQLEDLIKQLPPDNINSALGEMVNHAKIDKDTLSELLKRTYKDIKKKEGYIDELKQNISEISERISEGGSEKYKDLEKENTELTKKLGILEKSVDEANARIIELNTYISSLRKQKNEGSKTATAMSVLIARDNFINKCLNAIKALGEYNKMNSLRQINSVINSAYQELSEDYDNGRRLYIVQYDKKDKYRMASYIEAKFQKEYDRINCFALYNSLLADGCFDPQDAIRELAIRNVLEANSTGQAKINTLAFAKAILEYSRAQRDDESTEISRDYPFLIDSPFTELSNENLSKSASNLHTFANQVILMISEESLGSVESILKQSIGGMAKLAKNNNQAYSTLVK